METVASAASPLAGRVRSEHGGRTRGHPEGKVEDRAANVVLVEDHASFRQAMALLLDDEGGLLVAAQAGTLSEARQLVGEVDVAVVDLDLPDGDGAELIRDLRRCNPEAAVLILSAGAAPGEATRAIRLGADEVLPKSAGVDEIIGTVKRLAPVRPARTTRPSPRQAKHPTPNPPEAHRVDGPRRNR